MPSILFFANGAAAPHNDNHIRLPRAFRDAGWQVTVLPHDAVRLERSRVMAGDAPADRFDRVWVLGLGRAATFFDRMQILRRLAPRRLVTPVDALVYLHAKYAWSELMPETHAGNDAARLRAVLESGGDWVLKPTAGSFGREVLRVRADAHGIAALERMTGGGEAHYCLLQRYVPAIEHGEKRTLVAGGAIIGTYLRLPGRDFRTNLAASGQPVRTALTGEEAALVRTVHAAVRAEGVGFAAIDIAGPWLMEVNLANPGGLATLEALHGADPAPRVVEAIEADLG
jgi:glutathione synthase/RimK-type ligase-like ATP-grasp enzyme